MWSSAKYPNPHARKPTMSSSSFDEVPPPPALLRGDSFSHRSHSSTPSSTVAATSGSPIMDTTNSAQRYMSAREALLAEYQSMDPLVRANLPMPEGFINTDPVLIPPTEVDEPPSEFYATPRIRQRSLRTRARLQQMKAYTKGDTAPQIHPPEVAIPPHPAVFPKPSITNSSGTLHIGHTFQEHTLSKSDPVEDHLPEMGHQNELPRDDGGVNRCSNSACILSDHYDEYHTLPSLSSPSLLRNPRLSPLPQRRGRAGRPLTHFALPTPDRQVREQAYPQRSCPYLGPSSSMTDGGFDTSSASFQPLPIDLRAREEDLAREWDAGYSLGKRHGREIFVQVLIRSINMRLLIVGLAFMAYGLMACDKWADTGLYVLLGLHYLVQAGTVVLV